MALCWRLYPGLTTATVATRCVGVFTFVGTGLAARAFIAGSQHGPLGAALTGACAAAVAYGADWVVGTIALNLRMQLVERVGLTAVDGDLLRDIGGVESIDHLELPSFLDRVELLRRGGWRLVGSVWSALESFLNIAQLAMGMALLGTVNPWLLLLLAGAVAPLWFDARGRAVTIRADQDTSEDLRVQRHLFETLTRSASGKEIRVAGVGERLVEAQTQLWARAHARRFRAQLVAACWRAGGWLVFTSVFAAGLVYLVEQAASGRNAVADVVLSVIVANNLRSAVQAAVTRTTEAVRSGSLLEPYLWLRDYAASRRMVVRQPRKDVPDRLVSGIRLNGLGYAYPGTGRPALEDLTVDLPAGSIVAIIGEYGSGKTTLAKLLCKFHQPDAGAITVDGTDLQDIDTTQWWSAIATTFQDFGRYRTTARECVGFGDLSRLADTERLTQALAEADADALVARLPQGPDTLLGAEAGGVELSEGQWQKLALARSCMRQEPLLFLLDEPTASLDAPSEQAIFDRYMLRARHCAVVSGAITVVVSHRFSTVAQADLIIVMDHGRIAEWGSHAELLSRGSIYAQLYGISRSSYSSRK